MLLMFCAALVLGACEYVERPENASERLFTWFSYLAGEDLKKFCKENYHGRKFEEDFRLSGREEIFWSQKKTIIMVWRGFFLG